MNQSIAKAGFFPRLAAYLIDLILIGILLLFIQIPVAFAEMSYPDLLIFKPFIFQFNIFDIFFYVIQLAYFTCFTAFTGTTIGKRLFHLVVVDEEGNKISFWKALFRESIGKYLSGVILNLGYLMIFVDKESRALHDFICDTRVIYSCNIRVIKKVRVEKVYQKSNTEPSMMPNAGYSFLSEENEQKEANEPEVKTAEPEAVSEVKAEETTE